MCATANQIMEMYLHHSGWPGAYHLYWLRLARQMIERHRRRCNVCRDFERTTFNAWVPGEEDGKYHKIYSTRSE